jgi:hypothetical protein
MLIVLDHHDLKDRHTFEGVEISEVLYVHHDRVTMLLEKKLFLSTFNARKVNKVSARWLQQRRGSSVPDRAVLGVTTGHDIVQEVRT